jgi:ankyrin repeat protein
MDVAGLLLDNKANVNAKNTGGETPLGGAVKKGYNEMAELLRQHGGHE